MAGEIPAYQGIGLIHEDWMKTAMQAAPHYEIQIATAVQWVQRCIHGLKRLHRSRDLSEVEIYIGRATRTTLAQRWSSHAKEREHHYGAIVFQCETHVVEQLEDVAVRIVTSLLTRNVLCVGNANVFRGNVGRPPRDEQALVYMTWRTLSEPCTRFRKPTVKDVREIARAVYQDMPDASDIKRGQIERGLSLVTRLTARAKLYWWEPS